ncbi:IS4 family transposase [bacterium]|nr:IS4 family transposase [bacterium]
MYSGQTVFSQIMGYLPKRRFDGLVKKYKGNHRTRKFSCWDQFLCMSFAQLTYRNSIRDVEACLQAQRKKLYHMGIKGNPSKNNISEANQNRDWRIYAEFAQILIAQARELYHDDNSFSIELDNTVYALDASTIDLCLSLFPWAKFKQTKGAVKLHTLLDIRGSIPTYIAITDGTVHDVNILDELYYEPGSFYVMDRGYIDFKRLYRIHESLGYFVIRAKKNLDYRRLYSAKDKDDSEGIRSDQTIRLNGVNTRDDYPEKLRRVRYFDLETDRYFVYLTNNFKVPATVIAELYKNRWKVELFFKWIKQHLRIKSFFGTTFNAVKTQIWIAISVYVTIAIIRKELAVEMSLYRMLQILSISLFERVALYELFNEDSLDVRILHDDGNVQLSFEDIPTAVQNSH